jgi:hypothetical protein
MAARAPRRCAGSRQSRRAQLDGSLGTEAHRPEDGRAVRDVVGFGSTSTRRRKPSASSPRRKQTSCPRPYLSWFPHSATSGSARAQLRLGRAWRPRSTGPLDRVGNARAETTRPCRSPSKSACTSLARRRSGAPQGSARSRGAVMNASASWRSEAAAARVRGRWRRRARPRRASASVSARVQAAPSPSAAPAPSPPGRSRRRPA